VVRSGGRIASLEFLIPHNPVWRALWWLYTRAVLPGAGALAGRGWFDVGRFLGPSVSEHYRRYPLSWHLEAWKEAGMVNVQIAIMSLGSGLVMWGTKRDG
jgi:demethylmenaquinone methyltransferase/2-methoxy-6-polyprenyl-1,4-benzoquinol methylase